jgi:hypothetical protein
LVEQLIAKHDHLPTDRLFLVSWSGFSQTAIRKARDHKNVLAVVPRPVQGEVVLFADQVTFAIRRVRFAVITPNGPKTVLTETDTSLYDATGTEVGGASQLLTRYIRSEAVGKAVLETLHNSPQRDDARWFDLELPAAQYGLHLRETLSGDFHPVVSIEVRGDLRYAQTRLPLVIRDFQDQRFGHAETELCARPHLVVAALSEDLQTQKVTVSAKRKKPK